jgi:GTP-binding protein HflX
MERALLVTLRVESEPSAWRLEDSALELEELVATCGAEVTDNLTCIRPKPTPNLFIGKGKVEEIALAAQEMQADTVVFSHDLSGTQQRNLEAVIEKKTIDRTQLILDIFARHARTPEGKMQVELAQLEYLFPRLVGKGIILSRLGGGIGTRGPGEQKLESDRRRIRKRIDTLKKNLQRVSLHRATLRKERKDKAVPAVALVGYTNAGKSTLLNTLTRAGQPVSDKLFTTLDPLSRNLRLPNGENIVVSDTVGFLHHLPHHLIEAFKATLEEVREADLLIHVLDISHPLAPKFNAAVFEVLRELKAEHKPMVTALNKIDLLSDPSWLGKLSEEFVQPVAISAKLNQQIDKLLAIIEDHFTSRMADLELLIPHQRMNLLDLFYREGKVEEVEYLQKGIKIKLRLPKIIAHSLLKDKKIGEIN